MRRFVVLIALAIAVLTAAPVGLAPTPPLAALDLVWGDVDCDGDVDSVDSLKILRFVAGLSVSQQAGCPALGSPVELGPTPTPSPTPTPTPSPAVSRIAFMSYRDGNFEIYVMNADGSDQTNLTNNSAGDLNPDWSPDGSRITFVSDRDGNWEIHVVNANGSGPTNLTNNPAWDFSPDW